MNLVEHIKNFLAKQGLNWNGEIEYDIKTKKGKVADFRQAEASDFEKEGDQQTIIIDFGKNGQIALVVGIDLIDFHIYGIDPGWAMTAYPGDNDEIMELCDEHRDLSNEWFEYMLVNGGLVYRQAIIKICAKKKEEAEEYLNKRLLDLDRKIGYLEKKKGYEKAAYKEKITELNKLEKKIYTIEM
ncbi:MAG: hypothetical protein ACLRFL_03555 [Clostridia bacterium]